MFSVLDAACLVREPGRAAVFVLQRCRFAGLTDKASSYSVSTIPE